MLAYMLQNLEAIGCLGAQPSLLTTPLSATQQGDRYHVLTGTLISQYAGYLDLFTTFSVFIYLVAVFLTRPFSPKLVIVISN